MIVQWRKSSCSGGADDEHCVELGRLAPGAGIGVRDSKDPDGGHLTLTSTQFADLLTRIKHTPSA
ncbi:DUF397 domain-containing protein [Actinomadura montaniterrae]|uniref:DUF397 domain-containing protein n=1 Tax=Actinomadura montaniterrae TaxID=1803903 RepID=A0A6L3VVL7_9ACTN|nr:DUF397 domain-containing protein [Actinomadura montaniterrae]KAB2379001.1 DUF397 domain-containing protein [Actinomadura montaniterrae]